MLNAIRLVMLVMTMLSAATALADGAAAPPAKATPRVSGPAAPTRYYQGRRRGRGWFSGSSQNWYRSRGTPADNSTIPTPVNRHPKGRPYDSTPIFPKNM
jgi:hypothetical protein